MFSPCFVYWFYYAYEAELPFKIPFKSFFSSDERYDAEKNIYKDVPFSVIKENEQKRLKATLIALIIPIVLCVVAWFYDAKNSESLVSFLLFTCSAPFMIFLKGVSEFYYTCTYFKEQ
jgi:hypothetical protein